ncbi:hypothetical protein IVB33_23405 [Bradyrhizobium sp. 24]|uniref:hypothetical protein n=1 Tax=unclassified Bradyrhizobium TaxID=2631580 RepID=UPI001FF9D5CA|nr:MULTISPECIES: hypothetical protein [unclassified Bradyrhizobium]MCK1301213.1 hypothetical protein [Bradyrhizobium sp. 37]MCK1380207.1 hypothetical protein [Bradyrhizobium sp. 24]MCK1774207.1 hypothetical protein [Bradyrhizobium sp. 134]
MALQQELVEQSRLISLLWTIIDSASADTAIESAKVHRFNGRVFQQNPDNSGHRFRTVPDAAAHGTKWPYSDGNSITVINYIDISMI